MTEMIERVAKAIWDSEFSSKWRDPSYGSTDGDEVGLCIHRAKAAIDAMREPTDAMIKAFYVDNYGDADGAWQSMIDEALKAASPSTTSP